MKLTATASGTEVTVTGTSRYTVACSTEEVARRVAYYTNTYQRVVKPTGSLNSHVDGAQLDNDREKRVVFRWVDRVITDVGLCNSFVEASKFYSGKNTGPIPQDPQIMKEAQAKDGVKVVGKSVEITENGVGSRFIYCVDEETAYALACAMVELKLKPKIRPDAAYRDDSWALDGAAREQWLVVRWDDNAVIQRVAVVNNIQARTAIRAKWDKEDLRKKELMQEAQKEHKPDKNGFLSKPIYRVEPRNGRSYWFAVRTKNDRRVGEDMRCANKSVAEAFCASDMRHGRAVSGLSNGHWEEGGARYMRVENEVVTECYDCGDPVKNRAFAKERLKALGNVEYGGLQDPDPETKEAAPSEEEEYRKILKAVSEMGGASVFPADILEEVSRSKLAHSRTGVIPKPSEHLMRGYQSFCNCVICDHVQAYQKQEADEKNKSIDKATEALIKTAAAIQDQKKVPVAQDLVVNANVTQSNNKSEATNKGTKESTMANDPKPVRVPSPLELEAQAAALRTAMRQLTKLVHEPLAAALAAQLTPAGGDPTAMKAKVGDFLKSEIGAALVASLLSLGISSIPANMIPGLTADRQSNVAKELRVAAMAGAGDTLLDLVMEPLRNVLVGLASGPAAEALTGVRAADVGLDDAQQETVEATAQQSEGVKKVNF